MSNEKAIEELEAVIKWIFEDDNQDKMKDDLGNRYAGERVDCHRLEFYIQNRIAELKNLKEK